MTHFALLSPDDTRSIEQVLRIYSDSFPANERQPDDLILYRIQHKLNHVYTGSVDHEIVFIAFLWPLDNTEFILLDYMATKSPFRGKGIASSFLSFIRTKVEGTGKYLVMEVEDPEEGENMEERKSRVAFYRNNGAQEIINFRYVLPSLNGTIPTNMILMIFPAYRHEHIDRATLKKLVTQIYRELYNKNESDEYLSSLTKMPPRFKIE